MITRFIAAQFPDARFLKCSESYRYVNRVAERLAKARSSKSNSPAHVVQQSSSTATALCRPDISEVDELLMCLCCSGLRVLARRAK